MAWTPPTHDPETELRDHLPLEDWGVAVAEICARHGIDTADLTPFDTGSDVVWAAGPERVVKLTAPRWRCELEAEERCLDLVRGRLGVRTPTPVASGELAGWPYIVMDRVPGTAIGSAWGELDHAEHLRLAGDLGRLTRALHRIVPADVPADTEGPDADWARYWDGCCGDVARRHARDPLPPALVEEIEPFLERVGPLVDGPLVLLHTELLEQHVFVERQGPRYELCALVDFADGRFGPAEYEFAAPVEFIFKGEPGCLRAFLLGYGLGAAELTPARSERMLAWALRHRLGRLRRMLRAVEPAAPTSLEDLARTLFDL